MVCQEKVDNLIIFSLQSRNPHRLGEDINTEDIGAAIDEFVFCVNRDIARFNIEVIPDHSVCDAEIPGAHVE
jgi:hypothetical protein